MTTPRRFRFARECLAPESVRRVATARLRTTIDGQPAIVPVQVFVGRSEAGPQSDDQAVAPWGEELVDCWILLLEPTRHLGELGCAWWGPFETPESAERLWTTFQEGTLLPLDPGFYEARVRWRGHDARPALGEG